MKLTSEQIKSTLKNLDGSDMRTRVDGDMKPLTFKRAVQMALDTVTEEKESKTEKLPAYLLATLLEAEQDCELTAEQVTLITNKVGKAWPSVILGRVCEIVDPACLKR